MSGRKGLHRGALATFAAVLLAVALIAPLAAYAAGFSYVIDEAGIVSAEAKERIDVLGREVEEKSGGAQIGVLTVESLDGRGIEEVAEKRFGEIGVGSAEKNDGILLVVAPNERKVRIEVGYGLEGAVPDAKAGRIIDEIVTPRFKAGDMDGGIEQGYSTLAAEVAKEYGFSLTEGPEPLPEGSTSKDTSPGFDIGVVIAIAVLIIVFVFVAAKRGLSGGSYYDGGDSGGGWGGGDSGGGWGGGDSGGGGASGDW